MKFRKIPVVIEATKWTGEANQIFEPIWMIDAIRSGEITFHKHPRTRKISMHLRTDRGIMVVNAGDYIIKGVKGELYPCAPDCFELTYEKVED